MNATQYLQHCREEVRKNFQRVQAGQPDEKQKSRIEGLLHAARLLELVSLEELNALIEEEHQAVYGESVAQRKDRLARKTTLDELKENDPDAYFAIPAVERRF
ncbi:hypothetical protein [Alteromonas gilva]|uniref:Glutamyl-tRNA amidotransferase n=1 Tax=Alteromonas gilva TaxID=2987522 RepID=A0ABT5KXD6_9ALTE|nr:hypothetical protein [Alteromonas gilva]MDC8829292.1 hypothetical protein [Alteromonas gilva]